MLMETLSIKVQFDLIHGKCHSHSHNYYHDHQHCLNRNQYFQFELYDFCNKLYSTREIKKDYINFFLIETHNKNCKCILTENIKETFHCTAKGH